MSITGIICCLRNREDEVLKHRHAKVRELSLIAACLMLLLVMPMLTACQKSDDHTLFTYKAQRRCVWSADGASETPVIIGDTIYYLGGYPWNNQIFLHAVDKRTGKEIWSTQDGIQKFKVDGDRVFATNRPNLFKREPGRAKQEGWLKALSSKDGSTLWRMNSQTSMSGLQIIAAKDLLYVLANSGLSGINKDKGTVEWASDEMLFPEAEQHVLYHKDNLIAELANRELGVFECKTGKLIDKLVLPPLDQRLPRVIQLNGDTLIVANGDGTILIIDADKRDKYISVDVGWINSKLTMTDKVLYLCSGPMPKEVQAVLHGQKPDMESDASSHFNVMTTPEDAKRKRQILLEQQKETRLNAIDLASGELIWQTKFEEGKVQTAPTIVDQYVCVGVAGTEKTSFLLSIDPKTGKIVSKSKIDSPASDPVFADGNIIVRGGDSLNVIDPATGNNLWSFKPKEKGLDGDPVTENSIVYIGGKDSNLYAFETNKFKGENAH